MQAIRFGRWIVFSGVALSLAMASADAQQNRPRPKHSGNFEVRGTILHEDSTPYARKKVFIVEVTDHGNATIRIGEDGVLNYSVADGKTNDQGRFRIKVPRANFTGDTLRFIVCLGDERWNAPDYDARLSNKAGGALTLEIDKKVKLVDMDKSFGPILVTGKRRD